MLELIFLTPLEIVGGFVAGVLGLFGLGAAGNPKPETRRQASPNTEGAEAMNPWRRAREAEQIATRYREALRLVSQYGCTSSTIGNCWDVGKIRGAYYGADRWCDGCVALAALRNYPLSIKDVLASEVALYDVG